MCGEEVRPDYSLIANSFGPPELHICITEVSLLRAVGSLSVLGKKLACAPIHPDFEQDNKLRQAFEDSQDPTRPTRFGGPLEFAIQAMCDRNMVDRKSLNDLLATAGAFIGPLLFADPINNGLIMLTHETTVYSDVGGEGGMVAAQHAVSML